MIIVIKYTHVICVQSNKVTYLNEITIEYSFFIHIFAFISFHLCFFFFVSGKSRNCYINKYLQVQVRILLLNVKYNLKIKMEINFYKN
jgi:hypothetical protein